MALHSRTLSGIAASRPAAVLPARPQHLASDCGRLVVAPRTRIVATSHAGATSPHQPTGPSGRGAASTRAVAGTMESPMTSVLDWAAMSYSTQYDKLFNKPLEQLELDTKKAVAKPDKELQAQEPGATKVLLSDVRATGKRPLLAGREWSITDKAYAAFIGGMHVVACFAPFTFSWSMVGLFFAMYFVSGCLGITLSYHRQLSHRSFQTPKWLEYILAYCGVLAAQGDPIEWVSGHRYHHLHTDTPLDPHSPYEGFWWSHMGWLLDNDVTIKRVGDRGNANDMESQWFYRWLQATWPWHVVAQFLVLFLLGGFPAVVWGGALRLCWVYHVTWFVNSAAHVWGDQTYNTGDLSRNNWWVGILAFGEGWHNNHHAFEFSARHGLEWWQFDPTWYIIKALQVVGLAHTVKLPSEKQKDRLRFKPEPAAA